MYFSSSIIYVGLCCAPSVYATELFQSVVYFLIINLLHAQTQSRLHFANR